MPQTIFEAYNSCKKKLSEAGITDEVFEAKQIIKHITGFTNAEILNNYNTQLSEYQENILTAVIHQRQAHYPLQYIFGSWSFYGREFEIGAGVLIPRADTEPLVEKALELIKNTEAPAVLDLCTGSGCIGVTIAAERSDAAVTLIEKYETAAGYAACNIANHRTVNAVLKMGDVTLGDGAEGVYDLIVSNPPYVTDEEMLSLQREVSFEPEAALRGGADGLDFYRAIINNYTASLKKGGNIALEVGATQADSVAELLSEAGFVGIGFKEDAAGIRRVVFGTAENV